jgi:tRNA1(Val) A37 N6-methylase TrmN6
MAEPVSEDPVTDDALTSRFRVYQRARGHRFSVDDRVTAWVAGKLAAKVAPKRLLDLGTGLGSVALMLAHVCPEAELTAVEAQDVSFALLVRNVARNGVDSRATLHHGDLREVVPTLPARAYDLVTGTPPYLPLGTATPSSDPQRAAARIELRGGIEAYLAAASHAVAERGHVVVCADGRTPARTTDAARAVGLIATEALHFVAREGDKNPLFSVWTLTREGAHEAEPTPLVEHVHVERDARGERTQASREVLAFFGV